MCTGCIYVILITVLNRNNSGRKKLFVLLISELSGIGSTFPLPDTFQSFPKQRYPLESKDSKPECMGDILDINSIMVAL